MSVTSSSSVVVKWDVDVNEQSPYHSFPLPPHQHLTGATQQSAATFSIESPEDQATFHSVPHNCRIRPPIGRATTEESSD